MPRATPPSDSSRHHLRIMRLASFGAFFTMAVFAASARVAWQILHPRSRLRPGILAIPLDVRGDRTVTLLASLISLVPGTLVVDVAADGRTLYVHFMDVPEGRADELRNGLKRRFEARVAALLE